MFHVFGVMVAIKLNNWLLSGVYLALFFLSTIFMMGFYAVFYGYITRYLVEKCSNSKSTCEFGVRLFSASLSIFIGVLWLSLIIAGKDIL